MNTDIDMALSTSGMSILISNLKNTMLPIRKQSKSFGDGCNDMQTLVVVPKSSVWIWQLGPHPSEVQAEELMCNRFTPEAHQREKRKRLHASKDIRACERRAAAAYFWR